MTRSAFTGSDKEFIESAIFFFLATADAGGPSELAFPDFGGNGIFKSLGNVASNRREFPEPAWKSFPEFNDAIYPRQPAHKG